MPVNMPIGRHCPPIPDKRAGKINITENRLSSIYTRVNLREDCGTFIFTSLAADRSEGKRPQTAQTLNFGEKKYNFHFRQVHPLNSHRIFFDSFVK
jgi:hypothetical protein